MESRAWNIKSRHSACLKCSKPRANTGGFTLAELLVSIGIFTIITTMAVFNNQQFNGNVVLTNLAYEMALSIRQAQFYGITVKKSSQNDFTAGYGIHIDVNSPTVYYLFEDRNRDHICDAVDCNLNNIVETFRIQKGNKILKVCVDGTCTNSSSSVVDISFLRPNPDAFVRKGNIVGNKAEICVISPIGTKRKIVVESTGQISISTNASSPCDN